MCLVVLAAPGLQKQLAQQTLWDLSEKAKTKKAKMELLPEVYRLIYHFAKFDNLELAAFTDSLTALAKSLVFDITCGGRLGQLF